MANVSFVSDVSAVNGRLCKRDNVVYALNKKTGKVHRYDYHGSNQPNSALQQAAKAAFKQRAKYASAWWAANKPVVDSDGNVTKAGSTNYVLIKAKYDAQSNIGNIYSFFLSLIDPDTNTITIGTTVIDITTATSSSSDDSGNSGGSSYTPGVSEDV